MLPAVNCVAGGQCMLSVGHRALGGWLFFEV